MLLVTVSVAAVAVGFGFSPVGAESAAQTERVSISSTGAQGNQFSKGPAISADGRFVAFSSHASNLVRNDTNAKQDVFVYDRATQETQLVSISSTGTLGKSFSYGPSISGDGRFVAFTSDASNLVRNDTNNEADVFVHDRITRKTQRVSISSARTQAILQSREPSISADGRFVAFTSAASTLVRKDTNRDTDVFVHDRATQKTRRVSISSTGTQSKKDNYGPSISADGRFVAFTSHAHNLVRSDTNGRQDVFVHDRATHKTQLISISSTGLQGNSYSAGASISSHGRFVAFGSDASNLVRNDTNGKGDVFVHDRATHKTRRVSISSTGTQSKSYSGYNGSSISADGRFVAFTSHAHNLVRSDTNGITDVFVHDRTTHQTWRVSISSTGTQANGNSGYAPSISADGRFVTLTSDASNLVRNDTNGYLDVFIRGPLR